jgi:hypothetical protein
VRYPILIGALIICGSGYAQKKKDIDAIFYKGVKVEELEEVPSDLEDAGEKLQVGGALIAVGGLIMAGGAASAAAMEEPMMGLGIAGVGFFVQIIGALHISGAGGVLKDIGKEARREEELKRRRK